jgi:pimeloyl-ACP methyl ester carboxylesterase
MADIYKSAAGKEAIEALYRRALNAWPVPREEIVVPTCEGDTFVVASGDCHAPPLVLFHGSGTNSAVWLRDVADWAGHHCVYAVDIIGEPGFSAPSRPALGSDAYVRWLDDVWNHLGLTCASIVGVSLGGWLALEYAVKRPARVASISLLSPSGIGAQNRTFLVKAVLLMLLGARGRERAMRIVCGGNDVGPEVKEYVTTIFRHFRPRRQQLPLRTDNELAALTMPVQVIVGKRDAMLRSSDTRDRMQRFVTNLHLIYLETEGHILPPQTTVISEFLIAMASRRAAAERCSASAPPRAVRSPVVHARNRAR